MTVFNWLKSLSIEDYAKTRIRASLISKWVGDFHGFAGTMEEAIERELEFLKTDAPNLEWGKFNPLFVSMVHAIKLQKEEEGENNGKEETTNSCDGRDTGTV